MAKQIKKHVDNNANAGGAVYGLGFVGALFYYMPQADGFGNGVALFLKAILWPAFFVYGIFKFLNL